MLSKCTLCFLFQQTLPNTAGHDSVTRTSLRAAEDTTPPSPKGHSPCTSWAAQPLHCLGTTEGVVSTRAVTVTGSRKEQGDWGSVHAIENWTYPEVLWGLRTGLCGKRTSMVRQVGGLSDEKWVQLSIHALHKKKQSHSIYQDFQATIKKKKTLILDSFTVFCWFYSPKKLLKK